MEELNFIIPGKVQAKQSVKFANVGGFMKKYTPPEMVNYANWVKQSFCSEYPDYIPTQFIDKAITAQIDVYFEIPKSFSKVKRNNALSGAIRPTIKPDCDNISKNILDALNGIAYPDDKQISTLIINKFYSETPYVRVSISTIGTILERKENKMNKDNELQLFTYKQEIDGRTATIVVADERTDQKKAEKAGYRD